MFRAILTAACLLAVVASARPATAVITFTQLDDDLFVVSHRVKGIGLRGKAMSMVYEKTASLCVAAGYTHYEILDQESQSGQEHESANASVRAQFHLADGSARIECQRNASHEYVDEAAKKLVRMGYRPPDPPSPEAPARPVEGTTASCGACTLEQIAAMARTGLTDAQIRAACPSD